MDPLLLCSVLVICGYQIAYHRVFNCEGQLCRQRQKKVICGRFVYVLRRMHVYCVLIDFPVHI